MKDKSANLPLCASRPLVTQYGEKVGDYFFSPLRKFAFTEQGVKRWYAHRLTSRPQDGTGFAAVNMGDVTVTYEHVSIPAHRAALVAHAFETMAARVHISSPGTYFVVASFAPAAFEGEYVVAACANGKRIWTGSISSMDCSHKFSAFLQFTSPGFVDFAINVEKESQTVPCRALLQYAIIQCDKDGGLAVRCDDRASDIDFREIVDLHKKTPFQAIELSSPEVSVEERADVFEREWTISAGYIKSQYQRSVRELVEYVLKSRGEASLKYCIFMVPRSGSTLLTELLGSTGRLGFPAESFVPDLLRTFSLIFSDVFSSYEEFLVSRLCSENGVFGIEIEPDRFQQEPEFFADVKDWRHVYIWRQDVLAQAISLQLSIETGVWHNFSGSVHDEEFRYISRDTILGQVNYLLAVEKFFLRYFDENGLSPYKISYEELIADPIGHGRRVAGHILGTDSGMESGSEGKIFLRPTAKARNSYYKALAICGGGEIWGYDVLQSEGEYLAVLHGVDRSLLDMTTERAPILFSAKDRDALYDKVSRYVTQHISSLPPLNFGHRV